MIECNSDHFACLCAPVLWAKINLINKSVPLLAVASLSCFGVVPVEVAETQLGETCLE